MPKVSEITRVYFSHDQDARSDDKVKAFFFEFRKLAKELDHADLVSLSAISCYSIFWSILEYMHRNAFTDKDAELLADDLRIDPRFVRMILDDFGLFKKENDCYISERLLRDVEKVKQRSQEKSENAKKGWLLAAFNKHYQDVFGKEPVLSSEEIENLNTYSKKIPDFKKVLPDIIYTLKFIHFDENIKTKPLCDWLLKNNNLARVYNGEYGPLKHKKTAKELKAEEELKQQKEKEIQQQQENEEQIINSISSKAVAIDYIIDNSVNYNFLSPDCNKLMKKFDITKTELKEKWELQKEIIF